MFSFTKLKLGHMWVESGVKGHKVVFGGSKASKVHIDVNSTKSLFGNF